MLPQLARRCQHRRRWYQRFGGGAQDRFESEAKVAAVGGGPYFSGLVAYDRVQLMGSSWVSQCGHGDVIALIKQADFLSVRFAVVS